MMRFDLSDTAASGASAQHTAAYGLFAANVALQQIRELIGMRFLNPENALEHPSGGRIIFLEVVDQAAIAVDRHSFGAQILLDHVSDGGGRYVLGMTALQQGRG